MADTPRKLRASELAAWQRDVDEARMRWAPRLLAHKRERVEVSPFSFLRGSAPLFYRILRRAPRLARGPSDIGILSGDLHLENFGAYRPGRLGGLQDRVVFGINDFDDAFIGPIHLDVLRLLTSTLLAADGWGCPGRRALDLATAVLEGYQRGRRPERGSLRPPSAVLALLEKVSARKRKQLLESRTELIKGRRRFTRGARYRRLRPGLAAQCREAFQRYAARLVMDAKLDAERLRIEDLAFRIAGTGSLGVLRVAVLVKGRGGPDGEWMFEMKEEGSSAGEAYAVRSLGVGPERVITAMRASLKEPPAMLGTARVGRRELLVRRLTPQEDRLNWAAIPADQRPATLEYVGWVAGSTHRRGADGQLPVLSQGETRRLLLGAIELAGLHEAVALSHTVLTGGVRL